MKRPLALLSLLCVVVAVSGCAVGVRQPATLIGKTSALMHGNVVSTTGGSGSSYFEFDGTKGSSQPVEFEAGKTQPVQQGANNLSPGTLHSYRVCAEDAENPGNPFCSPTQRFRTKYDVQLTLAEECGNINGPGVRYRVTGLPPTTPFKLVVTLRPGGTPIDLGSMESWTDGTAGGFLDNDTTSGTWTFTLSWSEPSVTKTIAWDCSS